MLLMTLGQWAPGSVTDCQISGGARLLGAFSVASGAPWPYVTSGGLEKSFRSRDGDRFSGLDEEEGGSTSDGCRVSPNAMWALRRPRKLQLLAKGP